MTANKEEISSFAGMAEILHLFFGKGPNEGVENTAIFKKMHSQLFLCTLAGFTMGGYRTASHASLQHIVENMHQLPKTKAGWFSYYRDRNFKVMSAFLTGGGKLSLKISAWCLTFVALQRTFELAFMNSREASFVHKNAQLLDSVAAGGAVGMLYGISGPLFRWHSMRTGLFAGLSLGSLILFCRLGKDLANV